MLIVYEIIRYFYIGNKFNFKDELSNATSYFLIFIFIYVITSVLDLKRAQSSPLVLSDFIEKTIKEDYRLTRVLTSSKNKGVFIRNMKVVDLKVLHIDTLHDNPAQIYDVTTSYIRILESMQLPSQKETIVRLERLRDEAEYMLNTK